MSLCKPTIRHGAKYRLLKRCIPVSTSSQHPATAASWRNGPPILNCPAPHANAAFVKTAAFGLKRIAVNRWCFVNCWIVGCGRCRIGSATRQSLKKESTESSSSITRTIGQSEKRAAPFRKPAKCERKTICLSERGNKPIKPYQQAVWAFHRKESGDGQTAQPCPGTSSHPVKPRQQGVSPPLGSMSHRPSLSRPPDCASNQAQSRPVCALAEP